MKMNKKELTVNLFVLGIIVILTVLSIKLSSTNPTDDFMGITNPSTTYGIYFWIGIFVGISILIISMITYIYDYLYSKSNSDIDDVDVMDYVEDEEIDEIIDIDIDEDEFVELDDV